MIEQKVQELLKYYYNLSKKISLQDLYEEIRDQITFKKIQGTDLYLVVKKFKPGFLIVSDLASLLYCERKFWFMYNLASKYRYSINIVDFEGLEKLITGLWIHKKIAETFKNSNLLIPEYEIVDYELGIAGRLDLMQKINDYEVNVIELKCNYRTKLHESYVVQVVLYSFLLLKNMKLNPVKGIVITCNKIHKFKITDNLLSIAKDLIEYGRKILRESSPPEVKQKHSIKCKSCGFKKVCYST